MPLLVCLPHLCAAALLFIAAIFRCAQAVEKLFQKRMWPQKCQSSVGCVAASVLHKVLLALLAGVEKI
jgi:hypothetical protein